MSLAKEENFLFDSFSPTDYPLFYIALIRKKNTQVIDELLKPYGLNTNMWRVFGALKDHNGIHISDLSERIAIERTQLSRILVQMEEDGYVTRTVSKSDRRHMRLNLTPKGQKTVRKIIPLLVDYYENICRDLSVPEMKLLIGSLKKILIQFEQFESAN